MKPNHLRRATIQFIAALVMVAALVSGSASALDCGSAGAEAVFVASARTVDGPGTIATRNSDALRFSKFDVTVPASRRTAQIGADFDISAGTALYSWPSGNHMDGYENDVVRAASAGEGLEDLPQSLARSKVSRVVVVAHSLGTPLAVNTLARMRREDAQSVFAKMLVRGGLAGTAVEQRDQMSYIVLPRLNR
ncbi:MAG: alpha/beta hydrolase [Devosia sp.]|nr:alpha/beta hydrolase [Devosia sp.]